MQRLMLALFTLALLAGCGPKKQPELKSPCVSAESSQPDHPCVRRPANASWLS